MGRSEANGSDAGDAQATLELVESAGLPGILVHPGHRTTLGVNRQFRQAYGWSTPDVLGRRYGEIVHEDDRSLARDAISVLAFGGAPDTVEVRLLGGDGEVHETRWRGIPNLLGNPIDPVVVICRPKGHTAGSPPDVPQLFSDRDEPDSVPERVRLSDDRKGWKSRQLW